MHLKILLPTEVFADKTGVVRIVAPTNDGSFGFLEHRLDCAAVLVPGILTWETKQEGVVFTALDGGVLIKTGADVNISVRRAIGGVNGGNDLKNLQDAVRTQFQTHDKEDRSIRDAVTKMEAGLFGRLMELQHER
jgi:F-type H+-transporting ATPase subunit epsilon